MTEADDEITRSIYWQMLRELESHLDDSDALLKLIIEGAYLHYSKMIGRSLTPDHVRRNGGKWLTFGVNGSAQNRHREIAAKFADVRAFKAHCRRLKIERYTLADKFAIQRILKERR